jgi:hypothetical protein
MSKLDRKGHSANQEQRNRASVSAEYYRLGQGQHGQRVRRDLKRTARVLNPVPTEACKYSASDADR